MRAPIATVRVLVTLTFERTLLAEHEARGLLASLAPSAFTLIPPPPPPPSAAKITANSKQKWPRSALAQRQCARNLIYALQLSGVPEPRPLLY